MVAFESIHVKRMGVKYLARAERAITMFAKIPGYRGQIGQVFMIEPTRIVVVNAGGRRAHAQHQRRARRIAYRSNRVGVCEHHAAGGERVDIRGFRLGMSAEYTDPVVKIVYRDEQDIGAVRILCVNAKCRREKQKRDHE